MNNKQYDDIFNVALLEGARFEGDFDLPVIERTDSIPDKITPFDKAMSAKDFNSYVHFFINDGSFARIWSNPFRYLPVIAKFKGALAVDFSIAWPYPLFINLESVARSRTIGSWLQRSGVDVIPVARWGLPNTYGFAFDGIASGGTVAVGTTGCTKNPEAREIFAKGLPELLRRVEPKALIVYGPFREDVFQPALNSGTIIKHFDSDTTLAKNRGHSNGTD